MSRDPHDWHGSRPVGRGLFRDGCLFHGPVHALLVGKCPLDSGPEKHRVERKGLWGPFWAGRESDLSTVRVVFCHRGSSRVTWGHLLNPSAPRCLLDGNVS